MPNWLGVSFALSVAAAIVHSYAAVAWGAATIGSAAWSVPGVISAATQWGVPALTACLSAVLFNSDRALSQRFVIRRLLPKAFLLTGVWWLLDAAVWMVMNYPNEADAQTFVQCLGEVLEPPVNIRILLVIASTVLLYPLLWRVVHTRRIRRYCMLLTLCFAFLLPLLKLVPYVSAVTMLTDQLNWGYFTAWGFCLLLGNEMLEEDWKPWTQVLTISAGIVAFGLSYAATSWLTDFSPGFFSDFTGDLSLPAMLQAAGALTVAKALVRGEESKGLSRLSSVCAGSVPASFLTMSVLQRTVAADSYGIGMTVCCAGVSAVAAVLGNLTLWWIPGFRLLTGCWLQEGSRT